VYAEPRPIAAILDSPIFGLLMRVLMTWPFWASALAKVVDFAGARAEMATFGLEPTAGFAVATIATQLLGSALVIQGRFAWLGAGALAVFTLLTIPIAHAFWSAAPPMNVIDFHFAVEHLGVCGGLALAAIQARSARRRSGAARRDAARGEAVAA